MSKLVLIVLCVIFAVSAGYFAMRNWQYKQMESKLMLSPTKIDSVISLKSDTYKDSQGMTHSMANSNINSIIDKEATQKATELQPIIETAANDLQPKKIEEVIPESTKVLIDSVAILKDALSRSEKLTYYYKNKYLTLSVTANPEDTLDKGSFDYAYNADLKIDQYQKKDWFLGSKRSYIDISSNDPSTTVMGVKKYTIVQKVPRSGFRIQVSGGYNFKNESFSLGPTAKFDFPQGTIKFSYPYNFMTKTWSPAVSVDKDLIRF